LSSSEPTPQTAYRTAPEPRTLVVRVGHAWRTTIISAAVALLFLVGAGYAWFSHSTVDIRHHQWTGSGCFQQSEETHETQPLSVASLSAFVHHEGSWDARVVGLDMPLRKGVVFLLLMALIAVAGPRIATDRATLTLDERERQVRLTRSRFGLVDKTQRPLEELREAVLVQHGWETSAQLVFKGGERLDVAAPTHGDGGHAKLVAAVNAFLTPRGS